METQEPDAGGVEGVRPSGWPWQTVPVEVTSRDLGHGTIIVREWEEGGPALCRLCSTGCHAYRAADTGRPVCVCFTPMPVPEADAALYRERPGTRWMAGPEGSRLGPGDS